MAWTSLLNWEKSCKGIIMIRSDSFPPESHPIFVFGSNEAGRHGLGAAHFAYMRRGAAWRQGIGLFGQSYAIPTKDHNIQTLRADIIQRYVDGFLLFAERNPDMLFQVTQIGCGLAGHSSEVMAEMFYGHTPNCWFDEAWKPWLFPEAKFWGTYP